MSTFERKLNEALLLEMPHVLWFDKQKDEMLTIPGTDISFHNGFDFRIERYAPEDYARINIAITRDGVIGMLDQDQGVFFKQTLRDPIMRTATIEEVSELEHLPEGWLENLGLDTAGV